MIDPLKVLVQIPAYDNKIEGGLALGLIACMSEHLFGGFQILGGCSDISLARNKMVAKFLAANAFEWQVMIDSDIVMAPSDFKILMDYPAHPPRTDDEAKFLASRKEQNPEGVTLNEAGQALIVNAEYSRKVANGDPARFGLGFTRVHRSVYERLQNATTDEGVPRIGQYRDSGTYVDDFFPRGPGRDGVWFGEDTGFFHLCRLCGIVPRIEQRTSLYHVGRQVFPYIKPALSGLASDSQLSANLGSNDMLSLGVKA